MDKEKALQIAAQCWCDPRTENIEMNAFLATVFSEKLLEVIAAHEQKVKGLVEALKLARKYLEDRGIRTRGIVGRTVVLPTIDKALKDYQSDGENQKGDIK